MTGSDNNTHPTPESDGRNEVPGATPPGRAAEQPETGLEAVPLSPAEQVEELRRERDDLKDQLLRKRAEFENFRRRTERDRQAGVAEGEAAVLLELMPVIDHLEQALRSGGDASSLREGVELILRDLLGTLAKLGLVVHDPAGQPFDPLRDQALAHEAAEGVADGTVLETYRRGYLLGDRLLRPALVKVAKAEGGPQATGNGYYAILDHQLERYVAGFVRYGTSPNQFVSQYIDAGLRIGPDAHEDGRVEHEFGKAEVTVHVIAVLFRPSRLSDLVQQHLPALGHCLAHPVFRLAGHDPDKAHRLAVGRGGRPRAAQDHSFYPFRGGRIRLEFPDAAPAEDDFLDAAHQFVAALPW